MRIAVIVPGLAGAISILACQSAGAIPVKPAAVKDSASAASLVQHARYRHPHRRHYYVKCYREFVIGPYRCHRFGRWW